MNNTTDRLSIYAAKCESLAEFKRELLPNLKAYRAVWKAKVRELFNRSGYTQAEFASKCGVSQTMVSKWLNSGSVPRSRETYLRIALAAGLGLEETNALLLNSGYSELYAKSMEDSVYIFMLSNERIPHTFDTCAAIRQRIVACLNSDHEPEASERADPIRTDMLNRFLTDADTEAEAAQLIRSNLAAYQSTYGALYRFVIDALERNIAGIPDTMSGTVNTLSDLQGWSSSLMKCVYEIKKNRWFPTRTKLISLGIHLNMNVDSLNELLELAHMSPLYAKNPVECALLFAIENADLNGAVMQDGRRDLCDYVRKVLKKLDLSDAKALIDELKCRF